MSSLTIDELELRIQSSSSSAEKGIDALSASLSKLRNATKGGVGLNAVAKQLSNINTALNSMNSNGPQKLNNLANSLQKLSRLSNLKISSSVGNQIRNMGAAISSLSSAKFSNITEMMNALTPLTTMGKSNLGSFVNQLRKIPDVVKELDDKTIAEFTEKIKKLVIALSPLSRQLDSIGRAFSKLPSQIGRTTKATIKLNNASKRSSKGYLDFWAKSRMAYNVIRTISGVLSRSIHESNSYIENLNLFSVSLGKYADEAKKYAETVGEVMGIDPSEFMRNQGIFMTITKGFGVAEDKARLMSKNLTQLGYDISSFFNISFEDSMQKLQSGIAGELEPLRRLGYDLSVARLQQEALNLGITKSVNAMTQAEKSQLRYHAIMTQVTESHGDMARTLNAPANQLRILSAQITQCARALGNIFIPAINAVLPYIIAFAKILRLVLNLIGKFVGFELPEIDYSKLSSGSDVMGDLTDKTNDATSAMKKLKNATTGIDELNIISQDSGSGGNGNPLGLGGEFDIDLPEYDFLGEASSKVDEIVNKFKEWSGITEEIDTWVELLNTKLANTLLTVVALVQHVALASSVPLLGVIVKNRKVILREIKKFFKSLPEMIGKFWEDTIDFVENIDWHDIGVTCAELLVNGIFKLNDMLGTFFGESLPNSLIYLGENFFDVGVAIWKGMWKGLFTVFDAIAEFVEGFVDGFKKELGIETFSTLFKDAIGQPIGNGILRGMLVTFANIHHWVMKYIINPIQDVVNENPIEQGVSLVKTGWTYVSSFVSTYIGGTVNKAIGLIRSGWSSVASFVSTYIGGVVSKGISLFRSGWSSVADWVIHNTGGYVKKGVSLITSGWKTVSGWVTDRIGSAVNVTVNLVKGWAGSIKNFLGLSGGGIIAANGGIRAFASGGVIDGNRFWNAIPKYAGGTNKPHGSMFVAGENGAEIVGHVGGRTEVMNRFQLADVMYNAVVGGMSPFATAMIHQMTVCANKIIQSIGTYTNYATATYATATSYNSSPTLSHSVYENSSRRISNSNSYSDIKNFYHEYVEPTLLEIASDTKRQADKEEQTIVNVGGRVITETVNKQQKINGYSFIV